MTVDELTIESDDKDIYVVADGVRIAKRGHPGTPQAETWFDLAWREVDRALFRQTMKPVC
jgi:hypothetical protein